MEGAHCFSPQTGCDTAGLGFPIDEYGRDLGESVTGGYVYRGSAVPSLVGKYLFADFGSGVVWALTELSDGRWRREELLRSGFSVSSFGEDENGELYVVDYGGTVRRIISDGTEPIANPNGIVNAASFIAGPIAPGQLVSIFGINMGPSDGVGAQLDEAGNISRTLADAQVWFDDVAAPLLFVRHDQINAQVPYAVAGKTGVVVLVQHEGVSSNPLSINVAQSAPALFTVAGGTGPGAILNENSSLNSSSNPAARGSVVVLFATGEGQTAPPGEDGKLAVAPLPAPLLPVSVTIGGLPAETTFVGAAPGFAGLLQVNARVPLGVALSEAVPVLIRIGNVNSQTGLTLAVD
jgi:uncharacterized protein (TIGR03437 family)